MFKDYRSYIIKCGSPSKMKPPLVTREFHGEVLTYYLCVPCGTLSLSPIRRDDMKFVPDFSWCDQ